MEDNSDIEYLRSPSSKSGWHHVSYHKLTDSYQCYYKEGGVRKYVGAFPTAEAAARGYHEMTKDIVVDKRKHSVRLREKSMVVIPRRSLLAFAIEGRNRERRETFDDGEAFN